MRHVIRKRALTDNIQSLAGSALAKRSMVQHNIYARKDVRKRSEMQLSHVFLKSKAKWFGIAIILESIKIKHRLTVENMRLTIQKYRRIPYSKACRQSEALV